MAQVEARDTVVIIDGSVERSSALREGLAQRWLALEPDLSDISDLSTDPVSGIVQDLVPSRYGVVGVSAGAAVAVRHALEAPDRVETLVLVSPLLVGPTGNIQADADRELESRLGEIQCPTLVVFGQEDTVVSPDAARVYRGRISNCNIAFVYDAGHDIATERPAALLNLVADYLERRETFIVQTRPSVISP